MFFNSTNLKGNPFSSTSPAAISFFPKANVSAQQGSKLSLLYNAWHNAELQLTITFIIN